MDCEANEYLHFLLQCRLHELANKRRISVTGASKLLANVLYLYRGTGLSVGIVIVGWDEKLCTVESLEFNSLSYELVLNSMAHLLCLWGRGLYYVDSEGGRLKGTKFSVGSGSPYAFGVLEHSATKKDLALCFFSSSKAVLGTRRKPHYSLDNMLLPLIEIAKLIEISFIHQTTKGKEQWYFTPLTN